MRDSFYYKLSGKDARDLIKKNGWKIVKIGEYIMESKELEELFKDTVFKDFKTILFQGQYFKYLDVLVEENVTDREIRNTIGNVVFDILNLPKLELIKRYEESILSIYSFCLQEIQRERNEDTTLCKL